MTIQRQCSLQAQGIPGAQASRFGAQLHQPVPQPGGFRAFNVHLVAQGLASVAGLGHPHGTALEGQGVQRVLHRLGDGHAAGENLQQLLALGALDCDGSVLGGDVGDGAVKFRQSGLQMGQVLVGVGGVDHQQIPFLFKAVQVCVVYGAAVGSGDDAVLGRVQVQTGHVAGEHVLEEGNHLRSLHQDAAHVGHVEEAARTAGIEVLGHDLAGVLDGHLPAAEVHHRGPRRHMLGVQLGPFQFAHASFFSFCFLDAPEARSLLGNKKGVTVSCHASVPLT